MSAFETYETTFILEIWRRLERVYFRLRKADCAKTSELLRLQSVQLSQERIGY